MAKNKRRNRHIHPITMIPRPVGVGFVVLVSVALVYLWMGHKCTQYSQEIKRLEDQCVELDNEKVREETKWNAMKTADHLDELLVRHGLQMSYPNAGQVVHVGGGMTRGAMPVAQAPSVVKPGGAQVASGHAGF